MENVDGEEKDVFRDYRERVLPISVEKWKHKNNEAKLPRF